MGIKVNFSSKDIEKSIRKQTNQAFKKGVDNTCPKCGKKIVIKIGKNVCPQCKTTIEFKGSV
ncbi:hypothetical protein ACODH8_00585 [Vagococcus fluvialis]|uniref:hypothetical protein n=1 Tax=Vagococcus fluvialis TaxID=2738 RepID=UPI003B58C56D